MVTLQEICLNTIAIKIRTESFAEWLKFAKKHKVVNLKKLLVNFLKKMRLL